MPYRSRSFAALLTGDPRRDPRRAYPCTGDSCTVADQFFDQPGGYACGNESFFPGLPEAVIRWKDGSVYFYHMCSVIADSKCRPDAFAITAAGNDAVDRGTITGLAGQCTSGDKEFRRRTGDGRMESHPAVWAFVMVMHFPAPLKNTPELLQRNFETAATLSHEIVTNQFFSILRTACEQEDQPH